MRIGIDLGTSNTVAVLRWPDGRTRNLLFDGGPLLPSAIFRDNSGVLHVGRDALRLAALEPAQFEPNPKRLIDQRTVLLGDQPIPVVDLLAAILKKVAATAREAAGTLPEAVLTYPAAWGRPRRDVLVAAAAQAGWHHPQLVPEPIAAARYFTSVLRQPVPPGGAVAVFDVGGGTVDVAVIGADGDGTGLTVLGSGGVADVGGVDIDHAIIEHLGRLLSPAHPEEWKRLIGPQNETDRRNRRFLWEDVRGAKEMLSRTTSAPLPIPSIPGAVHLTRDELEQLATPLLLPAVAAAEEVLAASRIPRDRITIFLVGGASRMPVVARLLHTRLGVAPTVLEQPEFPVAEGALMGGAPSGDRSPVPVLGAAPAAEERETDRELPIWPVEPPLAVAPVPVPGPVTGGTVPLPSGGGAPVSGTEVRGFAPPVSPEVLGTGAPASSVTVPVVAGAQTSAPPVSSVPPAQQVPGGGHATGTLYGVPAQQSGHPQWTPPVTGPPALPVPGPRKRKGRVAYPVLAGLLVLALVAAGAWWLNRDKAKDQGDSAGSATIAFELAAEAPLKGAGGKATRLATYGDILYLASPVASDVEVSAIDLRTRKEKWTKRVGGGTAAQELVAGPTGVLARATDGPLVHFAAENGQPTRYAEKIGKEADTPRLAKDRVVLIRQQNITGSSTANNAQLWSLPWTPNIIRLYAVTTWAEEGRPLQLDQSYTQQPAHERQQLLMLDKATGARLINVGDGTFTPSPSEAGWSYSDTFLGYGDHIFVTSPGTGKKLRAYKTTDLRKPVWEASIPAGQRAHWLNICGENLVCLLSGDADAKGSTQLTAYDVKGGTGPRWSRSFPALSWVAAIGGRIGVNHTGGAALLNPADGTPVKSFPTSVMMRADAKTGILFTNTNTNTAINTDAVGPTTISQVAVDSLTVTEIGKGKVQANSCLATAAWVTCLDSSKYYLWQRKN
ncbi:hsp70 family protein [Longispora albida]|uniref:hsp70 family protein n=1 Tax=Longispora albida TaxID=203523 RepID=UPI00037BAAB7|nr:hsp70 family protein [Longispora albida]